ncbi:MAG: SurA N-terminal domain-containing protein [Chloroflexi bacterium]|nr:SurA N-terminal domain-containing protein [Chloroflexota bacterium]
MRAQQRPHGENDTPQEAPEVVAERRKRGFSFGIGGAFLLVIVGVVVFGYYQEFYKPPRVWAGSVNNVEFSMGDLVQRIRVLQGVNRYQGGQVNLGTAPFEYLQNLINAEILRQQAPLLGISFTDDEIDQQLRRQFVPTADPGQKTDPGQLEREFKHNYLTYLTATGLSDGEFRIIVEEQLSLRALAGLLSREIEDPQQQVEIQWIQLPLDGDILPNDVAQRLENEEFTRIAQELSSPSQYAGPDGYVGWVPQGAFPDLDDAIFGNGEKGIHSLAAGTFSEPIFTSEGFVIVKVLSGAEERELEDDMFLKLTLEAVESWQRDALQSGTSQGFVRMNFNSRFYAWVTDQVIITAPRVDRPAPGPDQILPGLGR